MQYDVAVLKLARALVQAGWTQNHWIVERFGGAALYCLSGAIMTAAGGINVRNNTCPAIRALNMAAFGKQTYDTRFIVAFNDTIGRTKDEVLALLDNAILVLESGKFMENLYYFEPPRDYLKPEKVIHVEQELTVTH